MVDVGVGPCGPASFFSPQRVNSRAFGLRPGPLFHEALTRGPRGEPFFVMKPKVEDPAKRLFAAAPESAKRLHAAAEKALRERARKNWWKTYGKSETQ